MAAVAAAEGAPSLKPSSHSDKAYLPQHFLAEPTLTSDHAAAAFETVSVEAPKGLFSHLGDVLKAFCILFSFRLPFIWLKSVFILFL